MILQRVDVPPDNAVLISTRARLSRALDHLEARLGRVPFLAGSEFTAADIMSAFCVTTMRHFFPVSLEAYVQIKAYLNRIGEREAYRRGMEKGDPGMVAMLS